MNWQEIFTILVPLATFAIFTYQQMNKKFDMIFDELKSIRQDLHNLDMRLARLEGRFDERGYWESREIHRTGTEDRH